MKRSIASVKDLADYFNVAIQQRASDTLIAGQYVARKVSIVSLFMQTTKGRDKICCLIQYLADLYEACIKFSNIPEIQAASSDMFSKKIASRIRESMKNGRKIFKFLKFFDSIRCLSTMCQQFNQQQIEKKNQITQFYSNIIKNNYVVKKIKIIWFKQKDQQDILLFQWFNNNINKYNGSINQQQ